jgi:hypothetical protein
MHTPAFALDRASPWIEVRRQNKCKPLIPLSIKFEQILANPNQSPRAALFFALTNLSSTKLSTDFVDRGRPLQSCIAESKHGVPVESR